MTGMKKVVLFILCVAFILAGNLELHAQKKKKKKKSKAKTTATTSKSKSQPQMDDPALKVADQYFDSYEYFKAAEEYLKVVNNNPKNTYALYRLAESYREYFDYKNAEKYYKKVVDIGLKEYPHSRYWYAFMLKDNGRYQEAKNNFEKFREEYKETTLEAELYKERALQAAKGCEYAIEEIKKPVRDFGFKVLPSPINTTSSEYSPVIFENDSSIILTSAREESTGGQEFGMLGGTFSDNFRFKQSKTSWVSIDDEDKFSNVNSKFNESAGSFTGDYKKFYFTRCDELIKIGRYEDFNCVIYVSKKDDKGKWLAPERLNENINMKGQWNSQPSVSPDGKLLFFVSKRPGGLGMHDIWYSISGGKDDWGPAINMGDKVNTLFIDMSPRYYADQKVLFFSSNGHEGFGGLDILMTKEEEEFSEVKNIGLPFNSNRDDFYFVMGDKKGYVASNREGGIGNDDIYTFHFESKELVIAVIEKDSLAESTKSITIEGKMLYEDTKQPAINQTIYLTDEKGTVIKTSKTNDEGNYRFEDLPADKTYKVILKEKSNLLARNKLISDSLRLTESSNLASKKLFENIYFDFDKSELRPEAKKVLDDLAAYYKKNKKLQIEVNANTDNIGSVDYNKALSEKRGNAAVDYLNSKGVDKTGIVINALGFEKPIASNENPTGRQLNRRVEFFILGDSKVASNAMVYVVQPEQTLYSIAKQFGMTVDELQEMNNLQGASNLKPFAPLRVRRIGDADIIAPMTVRAAGTLSKKDREAQYQKMQVLDKSLEQFNEQRKQDYDENVKNAAIVRVSKTDNRKIQLKPGEDIYTVQPHNTLFNITRLYGMTVDEIKSINGLTSDTIYIDQKLIVKTGTLDPTGWGYVVKEGDTISSIASKFGLSYTDILEMNNLEGYVLRKNMIIRVKRK